MDQVEEVKSKINIVDVVRERVALKKAGRNHKGVCPFHDEKTPSFMVNEELQIYKCFGCGKAGDVIAFVEETEGVDFKEALKILADRAGVKLQFKSNPKQTEAEKMLLAHELSKKFYQFILNKHKLGKVGREYLKKRGIGEKLINKFELGIAPEGWDYLYKYLVGKKGFEAEMLNRAGLLMKGRGGRYYDRFRGRVIFPLHDYRGRVIALAGRVLPEVSTDKEAPKYINSPETLIYHKSEVLYGLHISKEAIRKKNRVVVVEGELDMISSFAAGVGETVAIKGSALTEQQVERLSRLTKNFILALDADVAGDEATKRGIEMAERAGVGTRVARIKGGKDPDEVARSSAATWKKMVNKAVDVYEFYIESAVERNGVETVEGKRRVAEEVLPILGRISNRVVQAHYVKKMAELLDIGEENVWEEMRRKTKGVLVGKSEQETGVKKEVRKSRREQLEEEILRLLLEIDEIDESMKQRLGKMVYESVAGEVINRRLKKRGEVVEFIKKLPAELKVMAEQMYMEIDEKDNERGLKLAIDELEKLLIKDKLDKLSVKIKMAEEKNDKEGLKKWQEEFVRETRKLRE